jgi:hypothetical protein
MGPKEGNEMRFSRRNIIVAVALVCLTALVIFRIVSGLSKNKAKPEAMTNVSVILVDTVKKRDIIDQVNISGTIRPKLEAEIFPKYRAALSKFATMSVIK